MKAAIVLTAIIALGILKMHEALAEKVIVVPLFDSVPTGVAAIPVYCDEAILSAGASQLDNITCRRADSRQIVSPVPSGHFLLLTDIVVNRNGVGITGRGFISIGVNTGSSFPQPPRFDFTVEAGKLNHLKFSTPYLVFHEGENIGALNGINNAQGGVTMDVFISGYLVRTSKFGR